MTILDLKGVSMNLLNLGGATVAKNLGTRIANAREKKRWTQKFAAEKVHVSPSAWSMYEGNQKDPSLSTFKAICIELNVSADYLLGFDKEYKKLREEK